MPMTMPKAGGEATTRTVAVAPTGVGTMLRAWLRIKHGARLGREAGRLGSSHGLWWLLPLVVVISIIALAVTAATTTLPVAVYTLF